MITAGQRAALRSKGFRRLWLATGLSELGSNVGRMAFILLVHELAKRDGSDPESQTALVVFLETIPMLILGPIAGALVDRIDKRILLVASDVGLTLLMLSIPWLATLDSRWPLFCCALVFSGLGTVFQPARQSSIPELVEPELYAEANSLSTTTSSINLIAGMGLAAALIEVFGKDGTFYLNSAVFAISAVMMATLPLKRRAAQAQRILQLLRQAGRGLWYVGRKPILLYLTLGFFFTYFFVGALIPLLPAFCEEHLGMDPDHAPLVYVAFGLGGGVGGALGPKIGRRFGLGRVAVISMLLVGVTMIGFARASSVPLSLAAIAVGGALMFSVMVQDATIVQRVVPPQLLGRVFGARHPMQALGYLVATTTIMVLSDSFAPHELMLGAALAFLGATLLATLGLKGARLLLQMGPES